MLYRIFTENTPEYKETAIDLTAQYFDGFTVLEGVGYWQGAGEHSLCIEVSGHACIRGKVNELAGCIKRRNNQEAVLVQKISATNDFI